MQTFIYKENMNVFDMLKKIASSINNFSDNIPGQSFYELHDRIKFTASQFEQLMNNDTNGKNKIDRIRKWIKVNALIEECRSDLCLARILKYGDTGDLIGQLDEVNRLLANEFLSEKSPLS